MKPGPSAREGNGSEARLSRASAGRLSLYLRQLKGCVQEGLKKISSSQLGEAVGITDVQVRKDLAHLGSLGQPGIGYATDELIAAIRRALGIDHDWKVAVVGAGNLARALLRYHGFQQQGFSIVALFDSDASKIGKVIEGLTVHGPADIASVVPASGAELAMLTVPSEAAQSVADALTAAGIKGILNFAPAILRLPHDVSLVPVDLAMQLEQLAFLVQVSGTN